MSELVHIRGNLDQVNSQIKHIRKRLAKEDRFDKVLERFKSIRNYLRYFGVEEEEQSASA